jgi:hypothetical protein
MAKAKPQTVLDLDKLREMRQTKVRYGRANLIVYRWGQIALTPIAEALDRWRNGSGSEEDVARAYVRARVASYTPSFSWDDAQIDKLVPRITAVSREPRIKATTPAELAPELDALERKEREHWAESAKALNKYLRSMTIDWERVMGVQSRVGDQLARQVRAIQPNLRLLTGFDEQAWAKEHARDGSTGGADANSSDG